MCDSLETDQWVNCLNCESMMCTGIECMSATFFSVCIESLEPSDSLQQHEDDWNHSSFFKRSTTLSLFSIYPLLRTDDTTKGKSHKTLVFLYTHTNSQVEFSNKNLHIGRSFPKALSVDEKWSLWKYLRTCAHGHNLAEEDIVSLWGWRILTFFRMMSI